MPPLFNQLALKTGWVEQSDLKQAHEAQQAEDPQRPLGLVLIDQDLLSASQLKQLLDLQRQTLLARQARRRGRETLQHGGPLTRQEETRLLRSRLLEMGLLDPRQLASVRKLRRKRHEAGDCAPLWDVLVELDHLTPHQVQRLRKSLRGGRVICYRCREKVYFPCGEIPSECPGCAAEFPEDPLFSSGAWLVANWPQHVGDRLLLSLMASSGQLDDEILAACQARQRSSFPLKDLGKVLLELGHATLNQLYELYQRRQVQLDQGPPHLSELRKDVRLARLLVTRQLASLGKVNDALLEQVRVLQKEGEYRSLLDILHQRKLLTTRQTEIQVSQLFAQVVEAGEDIQFDLERILCEERPEETDELQESEGAAISEKALFEYVHEDDLPDVDSVFDSYTLGVR